MAKLLFLALLLRIVPLRRPTHQARCHSCDIVGACRLRDMLFETGRQCLFTVCLACTRGEGDGRNMTSTPLDLDGMHCTNECISIPVGHPNIAYQHMRVERLEHVAGCRG